MTKRSKRYDNKAFLYWWDIFPPLSRLNKYEAVAFVRKDTGRWCTVAVPELKKFLTSDRQTSRGKGNWGIKVQDGRKSELGFEPGTGSRQWLFMTVAWSSRQEG